MNFLNTFSEEAKSRFSHHCMHSDSFTFSHFVHRQSEKAWYSSGQWQQNEDEVPRYIVFLYIASAIQLRSENTYTFDIHIIHSFRLCNFFHTKSHIESFYLECIQSTYSKWPNEQNLMFNVSTRFQRNHDITQWPFRMWYLAHNQFLRELISIMSEAWRNTKWKYGLLLTNGVNSFSMTVKASMMLWIFFLIIRRKILILVESANMKAIFADVNQKFIQFFLLGVYVTLRMNELHE